jgi:transmembrane sensor
MKEAGYTRVDPDRIAYLIAGFIRGTLTPEEHDELDHWVAASDDNMRLFEDLTDEDKLEEAQAFFARKEERSNKQHRYGSIRKRLGLSVPPWLYLAAAVIIGLVVLLVWWTFPSPKISEQPLAQKEAPKTTPLKGIQLTLANGRTVLLDSSGSTLSLDEAQVLEGELRYTNSPSTITGFHTVTVPQGYQYKVVLPDGTSVWLNCESSLTYPLSFGSERKVELKGEGYFEVVKDAAKPFMVLSDKQTVTVLGTHFNVKSYVDDKAESTTLLEGKVKVDKGLITVTLVPGEQAISEEKGIRVQKVDTGEETAWTKGVFLFRNAPIESVAAQIRRWYGVEIEYKGGVTQHFNATVSRKEPLSRLLEVLEGTGFVHFTLRGNKLMIQP